MRVRRLAKRTQDALGRVAATRDPAQRAVHTAQLGRAREDLRRDLAMLRARNAAALANFSLAREHSRQNWVRFGPHDP